MTSCIGEEARDMLPWGSATVATLQLSVYNRVSSFPIENEVSYEKWREYDPNKIAKIE